MKYIALSVSALLTTTRESCRPTVC